MKRWLAVTVTGAVLALGAPAGAQETDSHISVRRHLELTPLSQGWFLMGLLDGLTGSGRFTCANGMKRQAAMVLTTALMKEYPEEKVISVLITALERLGCTDFLAEKPRAKPAYSGPSS